MPQLNHDYTYDEVASFYQHDSTELHWVITRDTFIMALRLREDYNPHIFYERAEVWVGDDSPTKEWGVTLANDTAQLPVFVKRVGAQRYTYLGMHEVLSDDATVQELTTARDHVPHSRGISRIVFLRKL